MLPQLFVGAFYFSGLFLPVPVLLPWQIQQLEADIEYRSAFLLMPTPMQLGETTDSGITFLDGVHHNTCRPRTGSHRHQGSIFIARVGFLASMA